MATIHLGIGLIITILNFIEQEKSFQGKKVFGKREKNFCFPPKDFFFFPSSQILEDELFPQGCFQTFFLQIGAHPDAGC